MAMPGFTEVLRNTVSGMNESFQDARRDLNQIVSEVSASVAEILGRSDARLELVKAGDVPEVSYNLSLVVGDQSIPLGTYSLSASGYPIAQLSHVNASWPSMAVHARRTFKQCSELENHFREMLADPNSPLVVHLAFLLRSEM
jgi:hypothetical protein